MNNGGSSSSMTTQAPAWQLPYQQYGQNQALSQYQNMPQLVAPFAPQQEQAISNITNLANGTNSPNPTSAQPSGMMNANQGMTPWGQSTMPTVSTQMGEAQGSGSPQGQGPWINSAQNYIQNTLGGNVMQNPQLGNLFNLGADQIQNRISSQFAGAGRNVDASAGANAQALGDFGAQLYGNAFNTQAGLQNSALGAAPSILGSQLGLQSSLYGAGQNVQNLAQQYIQAPQTSLNQYLSRVNGNLGATQATPYNGTAGAIGGGLLGSQLGNQIGQWWGGGGQNSSGANWGSILGGLAGAFAGG